jgi:hypothetical protein
MGQIWRRMITIFAAIVRRDRAMGDRLSQLLERLEGKGFYQYAPPEQISELKQEARATGYLWVEGTLQDYGADAEDLAEGGVQAFIERIHPFLASQGVQIATTVEDFTDIGYTITVNGRVFPLYTEAELMSEGMGKIGS